MPKIENFCIQSQLLRGNWMGDSSDRYAAIYKPPMGIDSNELWMVYFLCGWSGNGQDVLGDRGVFAPSLAQLLDQGISEGKIPPVVLVSVDGSTRFGSSQYINSELFGPHMDHMEQEIIPEVETYVGFSGGAEKRILMGHSSGGFASLAFAMLKPKVVSHIASFAGDCWYEHLYRSMIPQSIGVYEKYKGFGNFIEQFFSKPNPMSQSSGPEIETMMMLNMCQCYAPNKNIEKIFADVFFDPENGELREEIWKKFLQWDPLHMLEKHKDSLSRLKTLSLQAGKGDQYGLQLGHRQLSKKLTRFNIKHELKEFEAKHGGYYFRYFDTIEEITNSFA
ncbi:MAG: hypothetical protein KDD52_05100 [Bdellovibrionales bacterium]|nr:hypothetical protein [Bdellovibrionales bacterium]